MSKTVEVASIFRLDQSAVDRVRESAGHFTSFDWNRQVFSLSCNDDEAPNAVASALRAVYEEGANADLIEEPKLQQLAGTALTNSLHFLRARYSARNQRRGDLLEYSDDDSESEGELPSGISHTTRAWKPKNGKLPNPVFVRAVLHDLHCVVDRDPHEKHLDLWGVGASEALRRLTRLEDVLALHQSPIRKNMFVLESRRDSHRFETPALRDNQQLGARVIAPDYFEPQNLLNKHFLQLRIVTFEGIETPANLKKPERPQSEAKGSEESSLWLNRKYTQLGTRSLDPGVSTPTVKKKAVDGESLEKVEVVREQSRYLSRDKSHLVSTWAGNISPSATINDVETPNDYDAQKVGKQRQVRDSDDESSTESEPVPAATSVNSNQIGKNTIRKAGKRRIVKDSDEESDQSSRSKRDVGGPPNTDFYVNLDYFEQHSNRKPGQSHLEPLIPIRAGNLVDVEADEEVRHIDNEPDLGCEPQRRNPLPAGKCPPLSSSTTENPEVVGVETTFVGGFDPSNYMTKLNKTAQTIRAARQALYRQPLPVKKDALIDVEAGEEVHLTGTEFPERTLSEYAKDGLIPVRAGRAAPAQPSRIGETMASEPAASRAPSTMSTGGSEGLYVEKALPTVNMAHIAKKKLQDLEARIAQKNASKEAVSGARSQSSTHAKVQSTSSKIPSGPSERLQNSDEVSSREYAKTMAQKAGKGKKKKSKVAADQKRQNILADNWGPPPVKKPSTTSTVQGKSSQGLGTHQLAEPMSSRHGLNENVQVSDYTVRVATRLSEELLPILSPLRAFSGHLAFGIQLGQILVTSSKTNGIGDNSAHDFKEWDEIFNPPHGKKGPATTFTNQLTTNGRDIDYILKLKSYGVAPHHHDPWANSSIIFNSEPEERATTYEFHCQSKDNETFIVIFTETGEFTVIKPSFTLGAINLHYVGQVWDARAIVTGTEPFEVSPSLDRAITDLQNSLYVPAGRTQLELTYRRPPSTEIRVEKVICMRKTRHNCLKCPEVVILETVQIQDLILQNRPNDPAICRAFAEPYASMLARDRVRWKVSLLARDFLAAFVENEALALGGLVKSWTAERLLFDKESGKNMASSTIRSLQAVTSLLLMQMDCVGFYNVGSLRRLAEAQGDASGFGSLLYNNGASSGNQNGVPKVDAEDVRGAVVPDDSASQAGGQKLEGGDRWRVTHMPGCGAPVMVPDVEYW